MKVYITKVSQGDTVEQSTKQKKWKVPANNTESNCHYGYFFAHERQCEPSPYDLNYHHAANKCEGKDEDKDECDCGCCDCDTNTKTDLEVFERSTDLFDVPAYYTIAFATSADGAMKGKLEQQINEYYPNFAGELSAYDELGYALYERNCFALIIKNKYYKKADFGNLISAVNDMAEIINEESITCLAIPKLGCGGNGLNWDEVGPCIIDILSENTCLNKLIICVPKTEK